MSAVSFNKLEILQIAEAVAREKNIDKAVVLLSLEHAYQKAARSRYGQELDIRAQIDAKTGEIALTRVQTVADPVENVHTEISLDHARRIKADARVGEELVQSLPPIDFGRVQAMTAKQVILQDVREAERDRQYQEFKDRVGEIVNGTVKRIEFNNVIVDLGRAEAIMRRDQTIPRELLQPGDRVRCYIYDVRRETKGSQIFVSRAHGGFMQKLFAQEVPEVYDAIIEIKHVARDPGSRAKIAVFSHDSSIDPVGACVGMRGSRVQAVVGELQGEKIDIIPWSPDAATFIVNALQPAEVSKVVLDEDESRVEVVVPDAQLSLAIGRRGQNVRLASQLTGWQIDIMTETEESERRQKDFEERSKLFIETLNLDETLAQLLASEGFETVEEIAGMDPEELARIQGFDVETAEELRNRAAEHLQRVFDTQDARRKELGVADELTTLPGLTMPMVIALGEAQIKTIEDLAGLISDDLRGWTEVKGVTKTKHAGALESFNLSVDQVEKLIIDARVAAGWIDPPPVEESTETVEGEWNEDELAAAYAEETEGAYVEGAEEVYADASDGEEADEAQSEDAAGDDQADEGDTRD